MSNPFDHYFDGDNPDIAGSGSGVMSANARFGRMAWSESDLKSFAAARCIDVRRTFTRAEAQDKCELLAQIWDIGDDFLSPYVAAKPSASVVTI